MTKRVSAYQFAIIPEALLDAEVSDRAVRLFGILARYANDQRRAFPGRRVLKERLRCAFSTLDAAMTELIEADFVRVRAESREDGSRTVNSYFLYPFEKDAPPAAKSGGASRQPGRGTPEGRCGSTAESAGVHRPVGEQEEREPDNESQITRASEREPAPALPAVASSPGGDDDTEDEGEDEGDDEPGPLSINGAVTGAMCQYLARRVTDHRGGPEVKWNLKSWRKPMSYLLRRGPTTWAHPAPIESDRVKRAIDFTFDQLATPIGNTGFCWADQIRSPRALREHWDDLLVAGRRVARPAARPMTAAEAALAEVDARDRAREQAAGPPGRDGAITVDSHEQRKGA